jgi:hypothetical protein
MSIVTNIGIYNNSEEILVDDFEKITELKILDYHVVDEHLVNIIEKFNNLINVDLTQSYFFEYLKNQLFDYEICSDLYENIIKYKNVFNCEPSLYKDELLIRMNGNIEMLNKKNIELLKHRNEKNLLYMQFYRKLTKINIEYLQTDLFVPYFFCFTSLKELRVTNQDYYNCFSKKTLMYFINSNKKLKKISFERPTECDITANEMLIAEIFNFSDFVLYNIEKITLDKIDKFMDTKKCKYTLLMTFNKIGKKIYDFELYGENLEKNSSHLEIYNYLNDVLDDPSNGDPAYDYHFLHFQFDYFEIIDFLLNTNMSSFYYECCCKNCCEKSVNDHKGKNIYEYTNVNSNIEIIVKMDDRNGIACDRFNINYLPPDLEKLTIKCKSVVFFKNNLPSTLKTIELDVLGHNLLTLKMPFNCKILENKK